MTPQTVSLSVQGTSARRCPLCRADIMGLGFPVLPIKDAVSVLMYSLRPLPSTTTHVLLYTDYHPHNIRVSCSLHARTADSGYASAPSIARYETEKDEEYMSALRLGCHSQNVLAKHTVASLKASLPKDVLIAGVYVTFETSVSRVFFETYVLSLVVTSHPQCAIERCVGVCVCVGLRM